MRSLDPVATNERKDTFKREIQAALREAGPLAKKELIELGRERSPEQFDDDEACFDGCKGRHPRWRHDFDRAVYDLTQTRPKKIWSPRRGVYSV